MTELAEDPELARGKEQLCEMFASMAQARRDERAWKQALLDRLTEVRDGLARLEARHGSGEPLSLQVPINGEALSQVLTEAIRAGVGRLAGASAPPAAAPPTE